MKQALGILAGGLLIAGLIESCDGAEASTQSRTPWTIAQCDRLTGARARAVFNASLWSGQGWPLWRVVCLY